MLLNCRLKTARLPVRRAWSRDRMALAGSRKAVAILAIFQSLASELSHVF